MEMRPTKLVDVPLELVPAVEGMIAAHRAGGVRTLEYSNLAKPPSKRWIHLPLAMGMWIVTALFTLLMLPMVTLIQAVSGGTSGR